MAAANKHSIENTVNRRAIIECPVNSSQRRRLQLERVGLPAWILYANVYMLRVCHQPVFVSVTQSRPPILISCVVVCIEIPDARDPVHYQRIGRAAVPRRDADGSDQGPPQEAPEGWGPRHGNGQRARPGKDVPNRSRRAMITRACGEGVPVSSRQNVSRHCSKYVK